MLLPDTGMITPWGEGSAPIVGIGLRTVAVETPRLQSDVAVITALIEP